MFPIFELKKRSKKLPTRGPEKKRSSSTKGSSSLRISYDSQLGFFSAALLHMEVSFQVAKNSKDHQFPLHKSLQARVFYELGFVSNSDSM